MFQYVSRWYDMVRVNNWVEIINRLNKCLSSWKVRLLAFGGRQTLTKAVLDDEKGISWVKWSSVMAIFDTGGLDIGSIYAKILGLLAKWRWSFCNESRALWHSVIHSLHGADDIGHVIDNKGIHFRDSFFKKVGNGENTLFWKHGWFDSGPAFMVLFPRLFAPENNKDCVISDRWVKDGDDALILGKWSRRNVKNFLAFLKCFQYVSRWCDMARVNNWVEIINRLNKCLSSWKVRLLSFGGRQTLTKAVLDDEKGISWVKWSSGMAKFDTGGLDIGSIYAKILGLLAKWRWSAFVTNLELCGIV
ncbi:RNA-directed DNA polymerase, eukaryota, Reverse transcriptase zinc-binding domain protein [Artemisia annua]|uniref:RNA-directed DNA polymerase, eukaryota, Reverse transcriptase zinc-binding domain protein n=1 Tax=Artemisia annua TaxID=35608 RepID=A0A2U1KX03_ARTAN|nr:RNA-directed DNA polymerase, eukaryota, Reverse transcriptase zinc-binding domain protein [Artemisia annua]